MSPRRRRGRPAASRALRGALRTLADAARRAWRAVHRPGPRVEVLLTDRGRARALAGEVHATLRRLRCVLGPALPDGIAVVVQQAVRADRSVAGCCEVGRRPDGGRFLLVRVALSVEGRRLGDDEVLAALADQVVAHADLGARESVPFELAPPTAAEAARPVALRGDPLVGRADGRADRAA